MNSTALGAKKENIIFISEAHEKFYYEKLKQVWYDIGVKTSFVQITLAKYTKKLLNSHPIGFSKATLQTFFVHYHNANM